MPTTAPAAPRRRRRSVRITPLRIMIAAMLAGALILGGGLLFARYWTPSHGRYPVQGLTITAQSGAINWRMARTGGADFAYILATSGSRARDAAFDDYLAGARDEGLRYGAIHRYSLCERPYDQATSFIATVPRDAQMLPPVVQLDLWEGCTARPNRDTLLADLNIFLNQIETHSAKPALIRVSRDFEVHYDVASGINRSLWLEGAFLPPDYATRRWVIWTASTWRRVNGIDGLIEWNVVRP